MSITISETAAFLKERDCFAILTHRQPDGDTLGASAALCRMLRSLGKTAHVLDNAEISPAYAWLHQDLSKPTAGERDTILCVDVAAPHLLPKEFQPYLGRIDLRIDHHSGNDHFSHRELVDSSCGACTEIIYELGRAMGVPLDQPTADALYTGTITDTCCFQFANTTAHTLAVASACVAAGARNFELYQSIFEDRIPQRLKLQSYIAEHMKVFCHGKLCIVSIPLAVQESFGTNREDLNNVLNFPQALSKAQVAATLLEESVGRTRLSLRSTPGIDCSGVAATFGGGGHRVSAGANMALPLDEATTSVEEEMLNQFGDTI